MTSVPKIRKAWVAALAVVLFVAWYWLDTKTERDFVGRVQQEIGKSAQKLDLAKLMPGKWETVCGSHGYDRPIHLKKYGRTYPAAGAAQDGAWELVFINADGSHESVAGLMMGSDSTLAAWTGHTQNLLGKLETKPNG